MMPELHDVTIPNTPYFSLLRARLDFLGARQHLISENIANASTPGYTPRDVDEKAFVRALESASRAQESSGRGAFAQGGSKMPETRIIDRPDSETTFDGNSVVLEEQAMRAMETRMQFETGLSLYQKGLQMLRLAARAPGR